MPSSQQQIEIKQQLSHKAKRNQANFGLSTTVSMPAKNNKNGGGAPSSDMEQMNEALCMTLVH